MSKGSNITGFYKERKINLGIIIFAVILIYIFVCIVLSFKSESIVGYQVKTGQLSENRIYNGIAIRSENTVYNDKSGYVNYFVAEGERAAYNNLIYCIDESGKISDLVGKNPNADNSLSESELRSLRQEMQLFSKNFDETYYPESISFESRITNELSKIENRRIIDDVSLITASNDIIDYYRLSDAGIILYYLDGYENYSASDLSEKDFDISNYHQVVNLNDSLLESGSFAYKYVNDENWSIVILVPNSEVERITSSDYVEVKFSKTLNTSWGKVELISNLGENSLISLSFTNSMITFAKDRFVEIELLLEEDNGLKVPNTAIAEKPFFLIDKSYVTKGNNSSEYVVLRKEYGENGETIKSISVDVAKEEDDVYYVDTISLNYGDILVKPEAAVTTNDDNTFVVGKQGTLIGVYNINKGYADFNRIEIKYSNDEYSIIIPNSMYGLRAYDYIALDASIVTDKDFVY